MRTHVASLLILTLFVVASGVANTSLIVGNTGIFGWPPMSWNPNVSCPVVLGDLRAILGSAYPNQSLVGSPYQVNATDGGIPNKRMLRPPCSIVNINGQTEPALVQVSGVYLSSYETEDCSTKFDPINNGTLYPDINGDGRPDTFCDSTGNLFLVGDTNSFNPRIHIEFDHDWIAAGWAGASTTYNSNVTIPRCPPVPPPMTNFCNGTPIAVQGFVYWDNKDPGPHWELHALTAWKTSS